MKSRLTYVEPPLNADGRPQTFAERTAAYAAAAAEQRRQQKQVKADAVAQRQAEVLAAGFNAPPPLPRKTTLEERQQIEKAEKLGRAKAEAKAEAEAAANAAPVNPYAARCAELKRIIHRPGMKRYYDYLQRLHDEWQAKADAKIAAAEKQAAIDADPQVKTARDYAAGLVKLTPAEFQTEAAEINGIAQQGDAALAWSRMRDLEARIWQHQDKVAAEKLAAKAATDADFKAAANAAEVARARAEHAAATAAELNPKAD